MVVLIWKCSKIFPISVAVFYTCLWLCLFFSSPKNHKFSAFGSPRREQYIPATTHAPPRFQYCPHTSWQSETEDDFHFPESKSNPFSKLCVYRLKGALLASFRNAFLLERNKYFCICSFPNYLLFQLDQIKHNTDCINLLNNVTISGFFDKCSDVHLHKTQI